MRPYISGILLASVVLISVICPGSLSAGDESLALEIVIGGLMDGEGGQWRPDSSPLKSPFGIDFDSEDKMYIVELGGGRVHTRDSSGVLKHVSGDGSEGYIGDGGEFATATFNGMHNCAISRNGDLYIADTWNHCVRKVDAETFLISTIAGTGEAGFTGDGGPADQARFNFVMCVTLNSDDTQLHIADLKNRRIRALDLHTGIVSTIAGNGDNGIPVDGSIAVRSPLSDPRAVAADSAGNVYILERGGHAVRVVLTDGTIHTVAGTGEKGFKDGSALEAQFGSPKHICVDDQDCVFIADEENQAIRRYDPKARTVETVLGRGHGDKRIRLSMPHGVCWRNGSLYVVDTGNNRILRLR